jgi:membrane protease YdiL (CAAX protease family)
MTDSPLTTPPAQPSLLSFFRSPELPSGFVRVCIYLILGEAVSYFLSWIARMLLAGGLSAISPQIVMATELVAFGGAFSAAWMMSRLEKRNFGEYGLPWQGAFGKRFWQGALFGCVEISAVLGALAALGYYHFGFLVIHGAAFLRWAVFWALLFVLVGLYEEFAFRGYVQFTLAQGLRFWPASVLLSIMFGARHLQNPGETWIGIAGVILSGLFWCFTLRRTGNLWFAVGMHASFDFGETFLYSVPDSGVIFPGHLSSATLAGPTWLSGGTAGPEASIFDFLMLLIFFYIFHRLYPTAPTAPAAVPIPAYVDAGLQPGVESDSTKSIQ